MSEQITISDASEQKLLGMEEHRLDIDEQQGQGQGQERQEQEVQQSQKTAQQIFKEFLWAAILNLTTAVVILCFIISLFFWILALADAPGAPWCALLGICGLLGIVLGVGQMRGLQKLSVEIDRLQESNEQLEEHKQNLEGEVQQLNKQNWRLKQQKQSMDETVKDLQESSDSLKEKLYKFEELHKQIRNLGESTGKDVGELISQSAEILRSTQMISDQYERDLIAKIAQDLEFLDQQQGLTENEYNNLIKRLPTSAREKFEELGRTFKSFAGSDHLVDYHEIQRLINEVLPEQFRVEE